MDQHSERKKWATCFADVHCVIFVVSLSCYDEMMTTWRTEVNCMVDALALFEETVSRKSLEGMQFILFLNKMDLFAKKILRFPFTDCPAFADFDQFDDPVTIHRNPRDYEQTTSYIKAVFDSIYKSVVSRVSGLLTTPSLCTHIICAKDRDAMEEVLDDIKRSIVSHNLYQQRLF